MYARRVTDESVESIERKSSEQRSENAVVFSKRLTTLVSPRFFHAVAVIRYYAALSGRGHTVESEGRGRGGGNRIFYTLLRARNSNNNSTHNMCNADGAKS